MPVPRLLAILLCLVPAAAPAATTCAVFDFAAAPRLAWGHLGPAVADLLSFRLATGGTVACVQGGRAAQALGKERGAPYDFDELVAAARRLGVTLAVTGGVRVDPHEVRLTLSAYRGRERVWRYAGSCATVGGLYDLIDAACAELLARHGGAPAAGRRSAGAAVDLALAIDAAGRMHRVWDDVPRALRRLRSRVDAASPALDLQLGLLVFRGGAILESASFSGDADKAVALLGRHAAAAEDAGQLAQALVRALQAFAWRPGARRFLVVYSNAEESGFASAAVEAARRAGIRVLAVPADGAPADTVRLLGQLARATGGHLARPAYVAAYRLADGSRRGFALADGELFRLRTAPATDGWQADGIAALLAAAGKTTLRSHGAASITSALAILAGLGSPGAVLDSVGSDLERAVLDGVAAALRGDGVAFGTGRPAGRIVVKAGDMRFPIEVGDARLLDSLALRRGRATWIGVQVVPATDAALGFRCNPWTLLVPSRVPPALAQAEPARLMLRPEWYRDHGLCEPNRWFFQAEILEIERYRIADFRFED